MQRTERTKPVCASCGAKFSHDNKTNMCKKCGVPDEVVAVPAHLKKWRIAQGHLKPKASTSTRRKRKHGVPRSKGRVK